MLPPSTNPNKLNHDGAQQLFVVFFFYCFLPSPSSQPPRSCVQAKLCARANGMSGDPQRVVCTKGDDRRCPTKQAKNMRSTLAE